MEKAAKRRLHPLMLAGTGSDVGKSIMATALCRIFKQDGYQPAPFKAQNMALNSYVTADGLEIGRAQAVQAEAAGLECTADMNPLLLKPQGERTSQVVLNGRPMGRMDAYEYFRSGPGRELLRREVQDAFDRLAQRHNPIVMEGAGSISELNLRHSDLVNLPMARHAGADVLLVSDIDRGGVFASVYGSIMLQTPEDKKLIKGIIINKFRGDLRLFDDGKRMMEELCGVPVLGVVPHYSGIHIDEEDSVALASKNMEMEKGKANVAVIMLRYISNYTDFNSLERLPQVNLFYTNNPADIMEADLIIIPGSKATITDLIHLRQQGTAQAIIRAHRQGTPVLGICGGYQMMGIEVADPLHLEGDTERMPGLGLLPVKTILKPEKTTRRTTARIMDIDVEGYEIHQGETTATEPCLFSSPLATVKDPKTIGTYLHGILDNDAFVDLLLKTGDHSGSPLRGCRGKDHQYDLLADHVRRHIDMAKLYTILTS